jgi:hypothetical protein
MHCCLRLIARGTLVCGNNFARRISQRHDFYSSSGRSPARWLICTTMDSCTAIFTQQGFIGAMAGLYSTWLAYLTITLNFWKVKTSLGTCPFQPQNSSSSNPSLSLVRHKWQLRSIFGRWDAVYTTLWWRRIHLRVQIKTSNTRGQRQISWTWPSVIWKLLTHSSTNYLTPA